jgi:hypothetical protein
MQGSGGDLAPWPKAPSLSAIHPRARRPHPLAVALVQLAHSLLSARDAARGAPPLHRHEVDLLLGTLTGSASADFEFWSGTQSRGPAFGSPSTFVYTLPTAAPAEIALALGLRGSLATVTAGSVSGIASIVRAASQIASGRARACLCGGIEFARTGDRRASGSVGQDAIALFLLEAGPSSMRWPVLRDWEAGFASEEQRSDRFSEAGLSSQEPPSGRVSEAGFSSEEQPSDPVSSLSPLSSLIALASAAVKLGASSGIEEIFDSSSDGHWARIALASSQRLDEQVKTHSM